MIFPTHLLKFSQCLKGKIEWDLQVTVNEKPVQANSYKKKKNVAVDQVRNE